MKKKNNNKNAIRAKYTMLLISIVSILIMKLFLFLPLPSPSFSQAFAISPSFVRQEMLAASGDWALWKVPNIIGVTTHDGHIIPIESATNISQCKAGNNNKFVSPSINSVSYISNGKNFNSTVWLTSAFKEPPLTDTLEPYQKQLEIKISNLTILHANILKDYSDVENAGLFATIQNGDVHLESNSTTSTIGNTSAYKLIYTNKTNDLSLKEMQYLAIKNGKGYDITYSGLITKYDQYLKTDIQPMINSLIIGQKEEIISKNNSNNISKTYYHDIGKFFLTYSHHGIKIQYPRNWQAKEDEDITDKAITLLFISPPTDTLFPYNQYPSWHEITFGMAIAIDSIQHPGVTDYRIMYNRTNVNGIWTWTRQVAEVSANDETRVLEEEKKGQKNYTSYDQGGKPYILFSFDLEKINFPQRSRVVFYIIDYFVMKHHFCRLVDITNWVVVPPPEFTMSATNFIYPNKTKTRGRKRC